MCIRLKREWTTALHGDRHIRFQNGRINISIVTASHYKLRGRRENSSPEQYPAEQNDGYPKE